MPTEEPAVKKQTPERLTVTAGVLYQTVIVVSLVLSILAVVVYHQWVSRHPAAGIQIATFDFPSYLKQLQVDMASGKITEQQMLAKLDELTKRIDSLPPNYVVLSGDCILGHPKQVRKIDAP